MTPSRLVAPFCAVAALVGNAALATTAPVPKLAAAQLIEIDRRFIAAFAAGDASFIARLTDQGFVYTGRDGAWLTREEFLATMRKESPRTIGSVTTDDVRVRVLGSAALVHAALHAVTADNTPLQVRYTDVYSWDGAAWKLVSAQHTVIRPGVSVQQLTGVTPASAPWRGQDPRGDDLEVLRTLNESYVQAFRAADVAWYDAHLAADYSVVFGDGSFHDRAAALADFARPHFATHIRSFPVGNVSIQRYGDLALIRAENDYMLKDGRKGLNRYTDVWVKNEGSWQCISAHITVRTPPG